MSEQFRSSLPLRQLDNEGKDSDGSGCICRYVIAPVREKLALKAFGPAHEILVLITHAQKHQMIAPAYVSGGGAGGLAL